MKRLPNPFTGNVNYERVTTAVLSYAVPHILLCKLQQEVGNACGCTHAQTHSWMQACMHTCIHRRTDNPNHNAWIIKATETNSLLNEVQITKIQQRMHCVTMKRNRLVGQHSPGRQQRQRAEQWLPDQIPTPRPACYVQVTTGNQV